GGRAREPPHARGARLRRPRAVRGDPSQRRSPRARRRLAVAEARRAARGGRRLPAGGRPGDQHAPGVRWQTPLPAALLRARGRAFERRSTASATLRRGALRGRPRRHLRAPPPPGPWLGGGLAAVRRPARAALAILHHLWRSWDRQDLDGGAPAGAAGRARARARPPSPEGALARSDGQGDAAADGVSALGARPPRVLGRRARGAPGRSVDHPPRARSARRRATRLRTRARATALG